jgi:hypothetical protein
MDGGSFGGLPWQPLPENGEYSAVAEIRHE